MYSKIIDMIYSADKLMQDNFSFSVIEIKTKIYLSRVEQQKLGRNTLSIHFVKRILNPKILKIKF